jgi:predicted permease
MRRVFRLPAAPRRLAQDIDEELAFHIDMRVERLVASGMDPGAARREALRHFGAIDAVRQSCLTLDEERERQMQRTNLFEELLQDVHYSLRTLRRNIGFTTVVVLTIGLGIGANASIFTLLDAILLRKLPVKDPAALAVVGNPVRVSGMSMGSPRGDLLSWPLYRDLVARNDVFTDIFATGRTSRIDVTIDGGAEISHPRGRYVSSNYFEVLGLKPARGRLLTSADDRVLGGSPVVVISYDYWMRQFNGGNDAIGKTLLANGVRLTIVGVAPKGFMGETVGQSRDIWYPLSMQPAVTPTLKLYDSRGTSWLLAVGRLRPGVTVDQMRPRVAALIRRLLLDNDLAPPNGLGQQAIERLPIYVGSAATGLSAVRDTFGTPLITLMAGVAVLLLIVCANVANLLLARAVARGREMSVRLAIGAGHGRLLRQLLTESLVLGIFGAAVGLAVASWGSKLLLRAASDGPGVIPVDARLDILVLAFTIALSLASVVLFGLAPAVRAARADVAATMRATGRSLSGTLGARGRRLPLGAVLIVAQVSLSLMLLAGAGLLVRSLRGLDTMDVGLARDRLLIVDVDLTRRGYDSARVATIATDVAARLRKVPGVAAVTFSENGIFSGTESASSLQVEGFRASSTQDTSAFYDQVGPGYVRGIGARLISGRDFSESDAGAAPRVVIVNETFAKFYFKQGSPLGRRVYLGPLSYEIVGVIADTKDHNLRAEPVRRMYAPYLRPFGAPGSLVFEVLASGDNPAALAPAVRAQIAAADPLLPIDGADPLSSLMRSSVRDARLVARVATGFGLVALLLASIGLYGVMTYAMARRTGEIGLRVALGAQRLQVIRMVLGDSMRIVVVGIAIGFPLALALVRLLKTQLYNVSPTDPVALGAALAVLVASGVVAAWLPAARAARIDPTIALREE